MHGIVEMYQYIGFEERNGTETGRAAGEKRYPSRHAGRDEKGHHRDAGTFFAAPKKACMFMR